MAAVSRSRPRINGTDCDDGCHPVILLERRDNAHTRELTDLKNMIAINNAQTKEILEIVGLGRAFFKVLGFIGRPILMLALLVGALATWIKTGSFQEVLKILQAMLK